MSIIDEHPEHREFLDNHAKPALREGWCIFHCIGSDNGPFQVCMLEEPAEFAEEGVEPVELECDEQAWQILMQGTQPHHIAARAFIRKHNALEWEAMRKYVGFSPDWET